MAFYNGKHESSEYSYPSSNIFHGEDQKSLLAMYRGVTSEHFTGTEAFKRCCFDREQNFADGSLNCNEYILFTKVSVHDMVMVDTVRESLPKMYCLYDAGEEVLIVKLMVGFGHEFAAFQFSLMFTDKLRDLGLRDEIIGTRCTRFGGVRRNKEVDQSFKPLGTRPTIDDWPSVTVEVGFSESLAQLRNDAHFWLTHSQLQTRIVFVIHINKVQRQIEIERWEVINTQRPHCTTAQYSPTISYVQAIVLREGVVYIGPALALPIGKVFDVVPPNLATGAFDFTLVELQAWNDIFWRAYP